MELLLAKQIVVPLALFASITIAFKAVLDTISRYRILKEGLSPPLLAELLQHDARQRHLASLRWGIFLVAIGLAFALLEALNWTRPTAGSVAVLAVAAGAAHLLYFRLSRRIP